MSYIRHKLRWTRRGRGGVGRVCGAGGARTRSSSFGRLAAGATIACAEDEWLWHGKVVSTEGELKDEFRVRAQGSLGARAAGGGRPCNVRGGGRGRGARRHGCWGVTSISLLYYILHYPLHYKRLRSSGEPKDRRKIREGNGPATEGRGRREAGGGGGAGGRAGGWRASHCAALPYITRVACLTLHYLS